MQEASQWMVLAIEKSKEEKNMLSMMHNTAAQIYHKLGQKNKAIEYVEKAIASAKESGEDITQYEANLKKLKKK